MLCFLISCGDFDTALYAFDKGDCSKARRLWQPLAENGDKKSAYYLGLMYLNGCDDLIPNYVKAEDWLEKAAAAEDKDAAFALSELYYLKDNHNMRVKWLKQASDWGDAYASRDLADIYQSKKKLKKAKHYYIKAATQGLVEFKYMDEDKQSPEYRQKYKARKRLIQGTN